MYVSMKNNSVVLKMYTLGAVLIKVKEAQFRDKEMLLYLLAGNILFSYREPLELINMEHLKHII